MIQAGGFDVNMTERARTPPIVNESKNGLSNVIGSVAMARTNDPDSATAQFFINVGDNKNLDYVAGQPGLRRVRSRDRRAWTSSRLSPKWRPARVSHMDDVPMRAGRDHFGAPRRQQDAMTRLFAAAATALFLGAVVTEIHSRLFAGRYFALLVLSVIGIFIGSLATHRHLRAHRFALPKTTAASRRGAR